MKASISSEKLFEQNELSSDWQNAYGNLSFDEATFVTISTFCPGKMFNPLKPAKWGVKVFSFNCTFTGFVTASSCIKENMTR